MDIINGLFIGDLLIDTDENVSGSCFYHDYYIGYKLQRLSSYGGVSFDSFIQVIVYVLIEILIKVFRICLETRQYLRRIM